MLKDLFSTILTLLIVIIMTVFLGFIAKAILSFIFEMIYIIGG